jgi:hypothetical protein
MRRIEVLIAVVATALAPGSCSPEIGISGSGVEVYNLTSAGFPVNAGELIDVRVPLENVGDAEPASVGVLGELLDMNGGLLHQRSSISPGSTPVFDLRPLETDAPNLIDSSGTGALGTTSGVGSVAPSVDDQSFGTLAAAPDTTLFRYLALYFTPFEVYPTEPGPAACAAIWVDSVGLLGSLELYRLDPLHVLAIPPLEAEPYVKHLADQLLPRIYDPQAQGTQGSCGFWTDTPDTSGSVAVMAYMLKAHGAGWGRATQEALRRVIHLPNWTYLNNLTMYNKSIPHPTMRLLFGEAACHAPSWNYGWDQLSDMFSGHLVGGGHEGHDLHYTPYHLGHLGLLDGLDSPVPKKMARALFELKSLLAAHMYLPGGNLGVLYTRRAPFFFPGTERERALGPVVAALGAGDDFVYANVGRALHAFTMLSAVVAARNPLAPAIRSLFLDKGNGYETWWLQRPGRSPARIPGTVAYLGEGGAQAHAWHFSVLPGGEASIGTSYGAWTAETGNKEGAAVRCLSCEQGFAYTYQWQAKNPLDTDDSGAVISGGTLAETAKESGYDAERMQVHRTRISLFDPRTRTSRWESFAGIPVIRGDERSLAYLTNWDHPVVGGEKIFPTSGGWYVGRVDNVFVAYRPLGDAIQTSLIDGGRLDGGTNVDYATQFSLDGRSGGVTILATSDEFSGSTLADFAAEMDARYWSFTAAGPNDGPVAETDYRAADGSLCRMKLEYMGIGGLPGLERRYIDCSGALGTGYQELTHDEFFAPLVGGQLMTSPFVSYDTQADVLTVDVPGYPPIVHDWGALRYPPVEPPVGCDDQGYLELSGWPMIELVTTSVDAVPSADVEIHNAGFGAMTVAVSFDGDDCNHGSGAPNSDWLEVPLGPTLIPAGASATIALAGSAFGCEHGEFEGELVFSSLDGNALDARLAVKLSVSQAAPTMSWLGLLLLGASVLAIGVRTLRGPRSS